jgi:hypothetical protein
MNSALPIICGTMLSAMVAAGLSHYWSVQSLVAMVPLTQNVVRIEQPSPSIQTKDFKISEPLAANVRQSRSTTTKSQSQEAFFNELLTELKQLKNENRDLRDLMGETNRDVMKLAFRVDTHSESFRPLPTSEVRQDTSFHDSFDNLPGVLPPRAMPVQGFGE